MDFSFPPFRQRERPRSESEIVRREEQDGKMKPGVPLLFFLPCGPPPPPPFPVSAWSYRCEQRVQGPVFFPSLFLRPQKVIIHEGKRAPRWPGTPSALPSLSPSSAKELRRQRSTAFISFPFFFSKISHPPPPYETRLTKSSSRGRKSDAVVLGCGNFANVFWALPAP